MLNAKNHQIIQCIQLSSEKYLNFENLIQDANRTELIP